MTEDLRRWVPGIVIGMLAGALTGLLAGVAARVAMRIIADNSPQFPQFTFEGTAGVIGMGVAVGAIGGAIYGAALPLMMRFGPWRGPLFGILITVVLFGQFIALPADGEAAIGPEWLGKGLFIMISVVSGIILAYVVDTLRMIIPMTRDPE